MKFTRQDLEQLKTPHFDIDGDIAVLDHETVPHGRYTNLRDIYVEGTGYYSDETSEFIVGLNISSKVTVPCAVSLKPVEIELDTKLSEVFLFEPGALNEEDRDGILIEGDEIDLTPYIWSAIVVDIPLKVVDPDLEVYPSGEGWQVLTEEDYLEQKKQEIDPRLAKLKEFKFD